MIDGKVTFETPLVRPKPETQPLPMDPYFSDIRESIERPANGNGKVVPFPSVEIDEDEDGE